MALQSFAWELGLRADRANGFRDGSGGMEKWIEQKGIEGESRMEGDTELEEGEALERRPADVHDLDGLSYLDTKVEAVLGHFQKDFEGFVFSEKLGSKYGGYGTFLPTYARPGLPGLLPAPVTEPARFRQAEGQSERTRRIQGIGSTAASKVSPSDAGMKNHVQLHGGNHLVDGVANLVVKGNKPSFQGQGALKVGSKSVYNGFNLNHSLSPATNDDPEDHLSGSEDEASPDRSPRYIIQVMTSHHLPPGGLLSPLTSDPLDGKEKPILGAKANKVFGTGSFVVKQDTGSLSNARKSDSNTGRQGKLSKEKAEKAAEKIEKTVEKTEKAIDKIEKSKERPSENRDTIQSLDDVKVLKKEIDPDRRAVKESGLDSMKGSYKFPGKGLPREMESKADKSGRDFTGEIPTLGSKETDLAKDLSRNSQREKVSQDVPREVGSDLLFGDTKEVHKLKDVKKSRETSLEPNQKEAMKDKRNPLGIKDSYKVRKDDSFWLGEVVRDSDALKEVVSGTDDVWREDESQMEDEQWRDSEARSEHNGKDIPTKESKGRSTNRLPKVLGPVEGKKKGKVLVAHGQARENPKETAKESHREKKKELTRKDVPWTEFEDGKTEIRKDFSKSRNIDPLSVNSKDVGKADGIDPTLKEGKTGKKTGKKIAKESKLVSRDKETAIVLSKDYQGPLGENVVAQVNASLQPSNHLIAGSITEIPAPAGRLVLDNWVECVKCQQWRLLAPEIDPLSLPDKWRCTMMTWLPGFNNCKHPEEFTTATMFANLGLPYPQPNPGSQPHVDSTLPPSQLMLLDTNVENVKPSKVQRSGSKKGLGKKVGGSTGKLIAANSKGMETGPGKSKSLNEVVQHPSNSVIDKIDLDAGLEDVGRVKKDKQMAKDREKFKRMRANEGDEARPHKQTVREEDQIRAEKIDCADLATGKQFKGKVLHDARKADSAGAKRKKKAGSTEENEAQAAKKLKAEDTRGWKFNAATSQKAHEDVGTNSGQFPSDDEAGQEGESGDRAPILSRHVARGVTGGLPLRNPKVRVDIGRETRKVLKRDDGQDARSDEKKEKNVLNANSKDDLFEIRESSGSDKGDQEKGDFRRHMPESNASRKALSKERENLVDGKKRIKGDHMRSGNARPEKKRMVLKNEGKDLGAPRESLHEERKGQAKRTVRPAEKNFQPKKQLEQEAPDDDIKAKNGRVFAEVSGIARVSVLSLQDRAGESPKGDRSEPHDEPYNNAAGNLVEKGRSRSLTSSFSKVSYSAESSAFGSKGASPIESTVSSSPVRSSKVDALASGRRVPDNIQNNHTTPHRHPPENLNSVSPSPKRSTDRDGDAQSDREEAQRQSHRSWDDRDAPRDASSGWGRDERYAAGISREGADFRKYERGRTGREDDNYWEGGPEPRTGGPHFPEQYDRHRGDDRYREREDSVDRYRDRDNHYDRRGSHEDRFRDRDKDRDRDRERARSRENWGPSDRVEERFSKERSARQDWGRSVSRERRPDSKPGVLNRREEPRLSRDVGREGRDRIDDENADNVHKMRANPLEASKIEHPGEDNAEAVPEAHKDDPSYRYDNNEQGLQKDSKSHFGRGPTPSQDAHGWEGDRLAAGRKDSDSGIQRNGLEIPRTAPNMNSRSRVDGQQGGPGNLVARGKNNLLDTSTLDLRNVEGKQGKEHKFDEDVSVRPNVSKTLGSSGHNLSSFDEGSASQIQKDPVQFARLLLKEAKGMKHTADRLKKTAAAESESTNLYLQTALKFLQSAHITERAPVEAVIQSELPRFLSVYNDTANLFDYCATTYEQQRDLAAAALAYICAAVTRFHVSMCKSASLKKDFLELRNTSSSGGAPASHPTSVQTPPIPLPPSHPSRVPEKPGSSNGVGVRSVIGESPSSSSASDVDNLNNQATASDKGVSAKGAVLPLIPGSTSNSADLPQRYPNFQNASRNGLELCQMLESWSKAQIAIAAAEAASAEGMLAVRRVGETVFMGNMDAVVRQVRLALEAIGH